MLAEAARPATAPRGPTASSNDGSPYTTQAFTTSGLLYKYIHVYIHIYIHILHVYIYMYNVYVYMYVYVHAYIREPNLNNNTSSPSPPISAGEVAQTLLGRVQSCTCRVWSSEPGGKRTTVDEIRPA